MHSKGDVPGTLYSPCFNLSVEYHHFFKVLFFNLFFTLFFSPLFGCAVWLVGS